MPRLTGSTLASLVTPQNPSDDPALKIAAAFAGLAGCHDNTLALARALHDGSAARLPFPEDTALGAPPGITTIEPRTGKMGWNDVKMALMLARDALQGCGISHPTGRQLQAVLAGGEVCAANGSALAFRGVLRMRAQGLNWGQIAAERYRRSEITSRVHARDGERHGLPVTLTESR